MAASNRKNPRQQNLRADGTLDVECWCRRLVVRVPIADVRAGRTRPCTSKECLKMAWRAMVPGEMLTETT